MPRDVIVKRLIKEIGDLDTSNDENLPIEYYEMRDYAKTRVLLKSSINIHLLIFILINIFLILTNIFLDPKPIRNFFELWGFWVLLGWGFLLWAHYVIVKGIMDIEDIDKKIFAIISLILLYIAGILVFTNYITNYYSNNEFIWWHWAVGAIGLIIGIYAYVVYQTDERGSLKNRINKEMELMKSKALIDDTEKSNENLG